MQMLLHELTIKIVEAIIKKNICDGLWLLVNDIFNLIAIIFFLGFQIRLPTNALIFWVLRPVYPLKDSAKNPLPMVIILAIIDILVLNIALWLIVLYLVQIR